MFHPSRRQALLAALAVAASVAGVVLLVGTHHRAGAPLGCGGTRPEAGGNGVAAGKTSQAAADIIVKFRAGSDTGASSRSRECALDKAGEPLGLTFQEQRTLGIGATLLSADRSIDADEMRQLVDRLEQNPDVEYAAPNETVHAATG